MSAYLSLSLTDIYLLENSDTVSDGLKDGANDEEKDGANDEEKDGAELSTCAAELEDVARPRGLEDNGLEKLILEVNSTRLEDALVEEIPNEL